MNRQEIISKIIENEIIMVNAISEGHKASGNDKFQPLRIENKILRCMYFGENSKYCKNQIN